MEKKQMQSSSEPTNDAPIKGLLHRRSEAGFSFAMVKRSRNCGTPHLW